MDVRIMSSVAGEKEHWLLEEEQAGLESHTRLAGVVAELLRMIAVASKGCRPLVWPEVTGARSAYLDKVRERLAHLDRDRQVVVVGQMALYFSERFHDRFIHPIALDVQRRDSQGVLPRTQDPFDTVGIGAPNSAGQEALRQDLNSVPRQ
jgi:hypothetical protein